MRKCQEAETLKYAPRPAGQFGGNQGVANVRKCSRRGRLERQPGRLRSPPNSEISVAPDELSIQRRKRKVMEKHSVKYIRFGN